MRRFLVDEIVDSDGLVSITGQEARHISRVLRMVPGDSLILMDRKGLRFLARIEKVGPNEVSVSIQGALQAPPSPRAEIMLCQALLRSGPMDFAIQKASELGVSQVFPFLSERTVVNPDEKTKANKLRHWIEIAHAASKQSDRERPPLIHPVLPLGDLLDRITGENSLKVILWEGEDSQDLKGIVRKQAQDTAVIGLVGPEGGFPEWEVEKAVSAGFIPVSMGRRILRAETAAVTFVAVLQYEWGDLSLESHRGR